MATTSLDLPDDIRERAAKAAEELGITSDAFMVEAIRHAADAVELRSEFVAQALAARTEMVGSGVGHAAAEVREYLRARIGGQEVPRPAAKPWRK